MITVLYEDSDVIVVEKPAGVESQSARGFEPDMVSRIRTHIHKLSPTPSPNPQTIHHMWELSTDWTSRSAA